MTSQFRPTPRGVFDVPTLYHISRVCDLLSDPILFRAIFLTAFYGFLRMSNIAPHSARPLQAFLGRTFSLPPTPRCPSSPEIDKDTSRPKGSSCYHPLPPYLPIVILFLATLLTLLLEKHLSLSFIPFPFPWLGMVSTPFASPGLL